MIVFKDYRGFEKPSLYLNKIDGYLNRLKMDSFPHYSTFVSLFLEAAELETGITDSVSFEVDNITALVSLCHELTAISAEMVYEVQTNKLQKDDHLKLLRKKVSEFGDYEIPPLIPVCIPEGFAFYGLYPEMYMEAAERFYKKRLPEKIVCIGLRSIGTALSALVEVVLKKQGCVTWSLTLRPKGHPFDRSVEFSSQISDRLRELRDYWFLVIDEGPGLSGSSICGTLEKLLEIGIEKGKIVVFPSWNPDAGRFVSEKAKLLWPLFDKFTSDFTDVWIRNSKLQQLLKMNIVDDFSAGNWRDFVVEDKAFFPAVYSHHERRKYLLIDNLGNNYIAKWIGLGKYGDELLDRARILANNNFCPVVCDSFYGFAVSPFISGSPLRHSDVNRKLLQFAAEYFLCINRNFPSKLTATFEKMNEMVCLNVKEGIGTSYDNKLKSLALFPKEVYENNVVAVDGRVMPHEWLWTGDRFYKVDQLEHHCDQFFPGCQNIAWDIAAFCIEFNLDKKFEREFLDIYIQRSADTDIDDRISFYRIFYLAFRLGYVTIAADSLSNSLDGDRFKGEIEKYKQLLINELNTF
jgi:hypothetical protein